MAGKQRHRVPGLHLVESAGQGRPVPHHEGFVEWKVDRVHAPLPKLRRAVRIVPERVSANQCPRTPVVEDHLIEEGDLCEGQALAVKECHINGIFPLGRGGARRAQLRIEGYRWKLGDHSWASPEGSVREGLSPLLRILHMLEIWGDDVLDGAELSQRCPERTVQVCRRVHPEGAIGQTDHGHLSTNIHIIPDKRPLRSPEIITQRSQNSPRWITPGSRERHYSIRPSQGSQGSQAMSLERSCSPWGSEACDEPRGVGRRLASTPCSKAKK
mmetsp:Transcript_56780/g.122740  ORF Transcript_56780/g.122740 Transcript_56780/m.122740 type:complete len:271 (-) Transcript_56780:128-940(-)